MKRSCALASLLLVQGCTLLVSVDSYTFGEDGGVHVDTGTDSGAAPARDAEPDASPTHDSGLDGGAPMLQRRRLCSGRTFSCAVSDGAVHCWGLNRHSEVAPTSESPILAPRARSGGLPPDVVEIACGDQHACALSASGGVFCWGRNDFGQVDSMPSTGDVALAERAAADFSDLVDVAASGATTCVLRRNGEAHCWGRGSEGQLGNGFLDSPTPVQVQGVGALRQLLDGYGSVCGVDAMGDAYCWGPGPARPTASSADAYQIDWLEMEIPFDAGAGHLCGLTGGTGMRCQGSNGFGQLGVGTTVDSDVPVTVGGLPSGLSHVALLLQSSCVAASREVWCWGYAEDGFLGIGEVFQAESPARVGELPSNVVTMAGGETHVCALLEDASIYCWGFLGETTPITSPQRFSLP